MLRQWHLLSLDAPTVAVLWTWFISGEFNERQSPYALASMFLSVWIVYVGDRILDYAKIHNKDTYTLSDRHRFHYRHRASFAVVIVLSLLFLPALVWQIPILELFHFMVLLFFVAAYFLLVHLAPIRFPKEFSVGAIFAVATFVPAITYSVIHLSLLGQIALVALLFSHNCLLIEHWERPRRPNVVALRINLILFIVLCGMIFLNPKERNEIAAACALSMILLTLLSRLAKQIEPVRLRALADLSLLTPLIFFFTNYLLPLYSP